MNPNPLRLTEHHIEAVNECGLPTNHSGSSYHSAADIGIMLRDFPDISLEATNRRARMLDRVDKKYAVTFDQFSAFLKCISEDYFILSIDGVRQFSYSSCYYDEDFACYFEHHQGRRQRMKVRTREYVDSGLKFFEVKLKGLRGKTNKHRIECDFLVTPTIGGTYSEMLNSVYEEQYKKPMPFELGPSLMVNYQRCTLVSRHGNERVTIDFNLCFDQVNGDGNPVLINNDFIIVETKSCDGNGLTDQAMKKLKIRKASRCSKYCIGVNLMGKVRKNNRFLHMIRYVRRNIISSHSENLSHGRVAALISTDSARVSS